MVSPKPALWSRMIEDDVHLRPVEESDLALLERIDKEPALSEPFDGPASAALASAAVGGSKTVPGRG